MISSARWQAAQEAEAAFHRGPWAYVTEEVRAGVRGMLRIDTEQLRGHRIIDVGCGPRSLLLDVANVIDASRSIALDPLTFGDLEVPYREAGIFRHVGPAESFRPWIDNPEWPQLHEAWCYNCLQHVLDPAIVLDHLTRYASRRVRLFEWIGVPETVNHPHVLSVDQLRDPFRAWSTAYEYIGQWKTPDFDQRFYAGVFDRAM